MEGEGWTNAEDLQLGDDIRNADGSTGEVQAVETEVTSQEMYNLTVDEAHTFFVGDGQWLVHNAGVCPTKWTASPLFWLARENASTPGERKAIGEVMTSDYLDMQSHVLGVMHYSDQIAAAMGKSEAQRILIARGALLHDIGKGPWSNIFNLNRSFTNLEYTLSQQHVWYGGLRLQALGVDQAVGDFALYHHPRYLEMPPAGTIDELIQIMTAGDQPSAGLIRRVYRDPGPVSEVLGWLERDMKGGYITEQIFNTASDLFSP